MRPLAYFLFLTVMIAKCCSQQLDLTNVKNLIPRPSYTNSDAGKVIQPAPPEVLKDYEQNPGKFDKKQLESIVFGYLFQTNAQKAIVVLKRILDKNPTDKVAIRWLGRCYMLNKEPYIAVDLLEKSLSMGDDESAITLAEIYLFELDDYHHVAPLVPKIIDLQENTDDEDERHDTTVVLLAYVVKVDDKTEGGSILQRTLNGLSESFIVTNNDTVTLAILAFQKYGQKEKADNLAQKAKYLNPPYKPLLLETNK